jgi:hypothetical protein
MSRPRIALLVLTVALVAVASIQARRAGPTRSAAPSPPAPALVPVDRASAVARATAARSTAAPKPRNHAAQLLRQIVPVESPPAALDRAAVRIARDPETGEIIAPEHSAEALTIEQVQTAVRKEAEGMVTIRNADGSETLNHEGRFADYTVIRMGPNGRPVFMCAHGRIGAQQLMRPAAPAQPRTEDR